MKAINTSINNTGDDDNFDRLLSYFQSQFFEKIIQFVPIRKSVFLVKTDKHTYILKGYNTNSRLRLQEAFTATLRKEGFHKTYLFLVPPAKEQLFIDGKYFGCIEYINPNKTAFTYQTQKNRLEGIELLEQFHQTTAAFESRYRRIIPKGHLLEKWTERLQLFLNNFSFLKYFMNDPFLSEIAAWGNWALIGMEKHRSYFQKEPYVILHGDVAHHNFIRDKNGRLHLIDFDLISVGPPALDYLQYANRILPYIDWSFDKLGSFPQLQKYLRDEAFLYALAYPADIFREWNRLIREKLYTDPVKLRQVMDLSISQFYTRKKFVDRLQEIVK
ncbi:MULTISPECIES: aminoglycoside phosphotransferase family protein [Bacillaceae]|uniref:aminoglycoside phosphotransferase family protein n=1 Tax=Bacillaceae TaxID=186817 RepID=UPI00118CE250|nr:aminoglycoside phosphotransferase family protein [Bacillus sp. S3]QCJ45270.1 aminoglycoside phosphotransferase [Bacillus sp. S3]